jgi:hypothetical protein
MTDLHRCIRLKKQCHPPETIRRRRPRKPTASKTAQLEEKLDSLVSLIKAGAQPGTVIASSHVTAPIAPIDDSMPHGILRLNDNTPTHNTIKRNLVSSSANDYCIHNIPALTPTSDDSTNSINSISPSGFGDTCGEPSPVEAEECLINFQTYKSKYFPFIHIPSTTSAQQLRQERPFLWISIMVVSSKSMLQQHLLGNKLRQSIAQELVVQSEKKIDLLLSLLTFIGWYGVYTPDF